MHMTAHLAPAFADVAEALGLGMVYQIAVSPDGVGRHRFTYVGPSCLAMNGVTAEQALAEPNLLYDMITPEHRAAFDAAEAAAIAGDGRFEIEVQMRLPRGDLRWRRVSSARTVGPDGTSVWNGLIRDVTEARAVAEELEAQRFRLEVAVEATALGFWEWNPRTNAVVWSERNKAIFGFPSAAEVTIDKYLAAIHPEDRARCEETYREVRDRVGGGDFAMEYRIVAPNGQARWILTRGRVVTDGDGPALVVGTTLDTTDRHEAEERRNLVMGELAHRAKNGLQVMISIIAGTARTVTTVEDFETTLVARMQAMADAQDLVTLTGGRPVQLSDLAGRVLAPFGLDRFRFEDGVEDVTVRGDVAAGLALLLHELATNAVKYGALSDAGGEVKLAAGHAGPGMAALTWRERGGPPVEASSRRGFGSRLMQSALRPQGGKVEPRFEPDGFSARMEFKVAGEIAAVP